MTIISTTDMRNEARAWVLRMADADVSPSDQSAFRHWYAATQENALAYESELDLYYALEPLRARFPRQRHATNPPLFQRRPVALGVGLALAASLLLFMLAPREPMGPWIPARTATLTEIHNITLPDGSLITLGAGTRIQMAFTRAERRVRLSPGEAYFSVAHDMRRPFLIETEGTVVRVVGTEFEVRAGDDDVRVTVTRGIVDVTEPARLTNALSSRVHRLTAGGQLSLHTTPIAVVARLTSAPIHPAAWREGFLVYEDASLAEVVADANRYSSTPIRIVSPELGQLRVTTAYRADQIDQILSIIQTTLPIDVQRRDHEISLVAKPSK